MRRCCCAEWHCGSIRHELQPYVKHLSRHRRKRHASYAAISFFPFGPRHCPAGGDLVVSVASPCARVGAGAGLGLIAHGPRHHGHAVWLGVVCRVAAAIAHLGAGHSLAAAIALGWWCARLPRVICASLTPAASCVWDEIAAFGWCCGCCRLPPRDQSHGLKGSSSG